MSATTIHAHLLDRVSDSAWALRGPCRPPAWVAVLLSALGVLGALGDTINVL